MGSRLRVLGAQYRGTAADDLLFVDHPASPKLIFRFDQELEIDRSADGGRSWSKPYRLANGSGPAWVQEWIRRGAQLRVTMFWVSEAEANVQVIFSTLKMRFPPGRNPANMPEQRTVEGLYEYKDGGTTFSFVMLPETALGVSSTELHLGLSPTDVNIMFATGKYGLVRSDNAGRTWYPVGRQDITGLRFEYRDSRRAPGDRTVSAREQQGLKLNISRIAVSAADKNLIFLRTDTGVLISRDGGRTLCRLALRPGRSFRGDVFTSRQRPAEVFIGMDYISDKEPAQLLVSKDGGCTFQVLLTAQ